MAKLLIEGGYPLKGRVRISGAKNAALTAISAAMLSHGSVYLENVPNITDVRIMLQILSQLGAVTKWVGEDCVMITPPKEVKNETPYELVKKLRASNLLLGSLLGRYGSASICLPGGCNIGSRPMDLHLKGLISLGAEIVQKHGYIHATASVLRGTKIYLDFPSVGATENIMMTAVVSEGQTIIENVAKEPEIVDLANLLNSMGAKVRGAGTDIIKIEGVKALKGTRYAIIPDRIEAGTFMVATAATKGSVVIENVIPTHLEPVTAKLREAGVQVFEVDDTIRVEVKNELKPIDIKTMPYPGFPTDMQSQMLAMICEIKGTSIVVENLFENRLQVAEELNRMGAKIKVETRTAIVEGVDRLEGAQVIATDLRAGAALIIAGLMGKGVTEIGNIHFIDRGYENVEEKFKLLGAKMRRMEENSTICAK